MSLLDVFLIAKALCSLQPFILFFSATPAAEGTYINYTAMLFIVPFPDLEKYDINFMLDPETV